MAINQWQKIARRNKERLRLIGQESFVETAGIALAWSPVDEGLFRNNWFSGLNKPNDETTEKLSNYGQGIIKGPRYTEVLHLSTSYDIGDQMYFTNSLPYARRLEYGHSKQAPHGMVRVATAQWPMIITRLASKIK